MLACRQPGAGVLRRIEKEGKTLSHSADVAHETATPELASPQSPVDISSKTLLARILAILDENKAENVATIDLHGKSQIADYMVVCSGRSTRQVGGIAQDVADRLKLDFGMICKTEGKEQGDWVLIDAHDVIVHVFRPEVRDFYQIEKMWQAGGPGAPGDAGA